MSAAPTKVPVPKPTSYAADPLTGNYKQVRDAQTVSGILSTIASLFVLFLQWKLRHKLFRGGGSFTNFSVLLMTVFQTLQDIALMDQMNCLSDVTDDDAFWTETGRDYSFKRCLRATWWLNESSGIMLQMIGIEMSVILMFIVVYERSFDYFKWTKYWLSFSAVLSIIAASVNAFGAVKCAKKVSKAGIARNIYDCPPAPDIGPQYQMSKNSIDNYFAVNAVGFRFCEYLRTAIACLSLLLCCWALHEFWISISKSGKPTKVAVYRELVHRVLYYPLCQALCRLAWMYTIVFGGIQNIDKPLSPEDLWNVRLLCAYIQTIFIPAGGVFMLVIFIRNNPAAREWFNETWAKITNRRPQEQDSLNDAFRLSELIVGNPMRSGAQGDEKRMQQVQRRCSMMDEDELIQKVVANRDATEQEWSEAFLAGRQHHRGSRINIRMSGLRRSRGGSISSEVDGSIESGNFELIAQQSLRRPSALSERSPPPPPPSNRRDSASASSPSLPRARLSIAGSGEERRRSRSSGSFSPDAERRRSRSGSVGQPSPGSLSEAYESRTFAAGPRLSLRVDNPLIQAVAGEESEKRSSKRQFAKGPLLLHAGATAPPSPVY